MTELNVSDIQHFSTGDGPGIRTTVFLKGCNLHCPWCHNPETVSPHPQTLTFKGGNRTIRYGRMMTVDEILCDVMEDEAFYRASRGGVTLSGGEPLLQVEGVFGLATALKQRDVSLLLDTAGCVSWNSFARILDVTDIFFFDWKTDSREVYSDMIGGDGALIYQNLCRLIESGKDVHVRIPLIPGVNVSDAVSTHMCEQLRAAGVTQVDLLPFHRMGSGKYEAMGRQYAYSQTEPLSGEAVAQIATIYKQFFSVSIE